MSHNKRHGAARRSHTIKTRVNERELKTLDLLCKRVGTNRAEFLRNSALNSTLDFQHMSELSNIAAMLFDLRDLTTAPKSNISEKQIEKCIRSWTTACQKLIGKRCKK